MAVYFVAVPRTPGGFIAPPSGDPANVIADYDAIAVLGNLSNQAINDFGPHLAANFNDLIDVAVANMTASGTASGPTGGDTGHWVEDLRAHIDGLNVALGEDLATHQPSWATLQTVFAPLSDFYEGSPVSGSQRFTTQWFGIKDDTDPPGVLVLDGEDMQTCAPAITLWRIDTDEPGFFEDFTQQDIENHFEIENGDPGDDDDDDDDDGDDDDDDFCPIPSLITPNVPTIELDSHWTIAQINEVFDDIFAAIDSLPDAGGTLTLTGSLFANMRSLFIEDGVDDDDAITVGQFKEMLSAND
jgi:hypothetical protein